MTVLVTHRGEKDRRYCHDTKGHSDVLQREPYAEGKHLGGKSLDARSLQSVNGSTH